MPPDTAQRPSTPRLVLPVAGAFVAAAAALALALWPEITAPTIARIGGVALMLLGLVRGYEVVRGESQGSLAAVGAVAAVAIGIALVVWPGSTLLVATVLLGVWMIADGMGRVFSTALETSVRDEVVGNLLGIGEAILGLLVIARPVAGVRAAALFVAAGLVVHALGRLFDAARRDRAAAA